jgi:aminoglycoside 2'-N-acetyltransferase I
MRIGVTQYKGNQELTYSLVPGARLTLDERREILALCSRAFETNYTPIYSKFSDPVHVLARLEGVLVSHALWNTRWLQCGDGPILRTAYVEAVATDPPYQGRGFATGIMRELQAHIGDYKLGSLSPSIYGFYERLGWEYWRGPVSIRTQIGLLSTPYEIMVLRLQHTPALDLDSSLSAEWRPGELW